MPTRVGLISDTHGLLRPEATAALAGSDRILHAGDIGSREIIAALERIAPVTAVRGNNDVDAWGRTLPERLVCTIENVRILLTHDLADVHLARAALSADVVVVGHSHRPRCERREDLLIVNPGSAGPRRFSLPIAVATMRIEGSSVSVDLQTLEVAPAHRR